MKNRFVPPARLIFLVLSLACTSTRIYAQGQSWKVELLLPAPADPLHNAWMRWAGKLATSGEVPGEAIAELNENLIVLREGEQISLPRPVGPEGAFQGGASLRRIGELQAERIRLRWQRGDRLGAAHAAAGALDMAGDAIDDACSVAGFLAGLAMLDSVLEATRWMQEQPEFTAQVLASVRPALDRAAHACVIGAENALRGEYQLVFCEVLARMPETNDASLLLDRFSTLGLVVSSDPERRGTPFLRAKPLLDREDTQATFGRALAEFLGEQRADDCWRAERFAAAWRTRVHSWKMEMPGLVTLAVEREIGEIRTSEWTRLEAELAEVRNPFGKLLLIMMVGDVDAVARAGWLARERVRVVAKLLG